MLLLKTFYLHIFQPTIQGTDNLKIDICTEQVTLPEFNVETKDLSMFKNFLYSAVSNGCWKSALNISRLCLT